MLQEHAPNNDFNRIPRQNTHSHIISKLQSPNNYHDSASLPWSTFMDNTKRRAGGPFGCIAK